MSEHKTYNAYTNNPLIHRDRRLGLASSPWLRSFAADDMSVLIVCRGPIRKEAIDVFREMGMTKIGILLSERDSITYPRALAPELRSMDPRHVHRVPHIPILPQSVNAHRATHKYHAPQTMKHCLPGFLD
jgi:hypothetical protein